MYSVLFIALFLGVSSLSLEAQSMLHGRVTDEKDRGLPGANITIVSSGAGTFADSLGFFSVQIPTGDQQIRISSVGYADSLILLQGGQEEYRLRIRLRPSTVSVREVVVRGEQPGELTLQTIPIRDMVSLPALSDKVSALVKTLPGVSSSNELSNQYTVRGGSYDENMIYINGIEVYRPFLVRSGQQEGLSIVNGDMVSNLSFSAGGFAPRYGDRISSVLDITYRKPSEHRGSVYLSLLNSSAHLEGVSGNNKWTYNIGLRYKTTRLVLTSLDDKGNYQPDFGDLQALFTWAPDDKIRIDLLSTLTVNRYRFFPESRRSTFGTVSDAVELFVYYEGQENDRYTSNMSALSVQYEPVEDLKLNFTSSLYLTDEEERFDIRGYFSLNQLDYDLGSERLGDSLMNIGVGSFLNHARNKLNARIISIKHEGSYSPGHHFLRWGIEGKREFIDDHIREWNKMDSAGYSLPYNGQEVGVQGFVASEQQLNNYRLTTYLQDSYRHFFDSTEVQITAGVRLHYWSYTGDLLLSPRYYLGLIPAEMQHTTFYFAGGLYYQPPFYKEFRRPDGSLNSGIKAQKSYHWVLGHQHRFTAWNRPFRLSTEVYYKHLDQLIPYKLNNIQILYAAQNNAHGYAAGIDFKLHGEFLPETESWLSLSLLKTAQDIDGDVYVNKQGEEKEGGWHPRPTDQRFSFSLFFQDYFPSQPDMKVHVNLVYNTGLPTSSPYTDRYDQVFRIPSYRRLDLGISKRILYNEEISNHLWAGIKEINLGLEVFNLLDINNTVSYLWINTINNQNYEIRQYGIPNYLTGRRINLRAEVRF